MSGKTAPSTTFSSPVMAKLGFAFFVALLATYLTASIYSPSFYEHIVIGNWILAHRAVPHEEIWASISLGEPWRSTSWAFELLLSGTEALFGETGHLLLKLLLVVIAVTCSAAVFSHWAKDKFFGGIVTALVCCGALLAAELEPSLAGSALFLLAIHQMLYFDRCPSWRELLIGAGTMAVYANTHRSFVVCILAAGILLLPAEGRASEIDAACRSKAAPNRLSYIIGLIAGGCISPYFGLQIWQAAFECYNFCWLELNLRTNPGTIYSFPIAFLLLLLVMISLFWHMRPSALRLPEALLLGGSAILALGSELTAPFALLIAGLCLSLIWGRSSTEQLGHLGRGITELKSRLLKLPAVGVLWVLLCLVIVNATRVWRVPRNSVFLPVREVDFFLEKQFPVPVLHESKIGSYLMYRFASGEGTARFLVVTSPRVGLVKPQSAAEQVNFERLGYGWQSHMANSGARSVLCRTDSALFSVLAADPGWDLKMVGGKEVADKAAAIAAAPRISWGLFVRRHFERQEGE